MAIETERTGYESSISHICGTLKWLLAAAGATTAVVAGSIQLNDAALATAASRVLFVVALTLVLGVLFGTILAAAAVLGKQRITAAQLAFREIDEDRISGSPLTGSHDPSSLTAWVQESNGPSLLGSAVSVSDLIQRSQRGDSEGRREAVERLGLVESALHLHQLQSSFNRLFWHARWMSPLLVVGLVCLVVAPYVDVQPTPSPVNSPLPVRVEIAEPDAIEEPLAVELSPECAAGRLGYAVGGTLENPHLILPATKDCSAVELRDTEGILVVPLLPRFPGREGSGG